MKSYLTGPQELIFGISWSDARYYNTPGAVFAVSAYATKMDRSLLLADYEAVATADLTKASCPLNLGRPFLSRHSLLNALWLRRRGS